MFSNVEGGTIKVRKSRVQIINPQVEHVSENIKTYFIELLDKPLEEIDWLTKIYLLKFFLKRGIENIPVLRLT